MPLIDAIEQLDIALAIPWIGGCIRDELLHHNEAMVIDFLGKRIDQATAATTVDRIQSMIDEYGRDLNEIRNDLILSYRNLIHAKRSLLLGNMIDLRTHLVWSLIHLGNCDHMRLTGITPVTDSFSKLGGGPATPR